MSVTTRTTPQKILILGESNSVTNGGWVNSFAETLGKQFKVENSSIGSSGIFNALFKLFRRHVQLEDLRAVVIDSNIQDTLFFKSDITYYFEILQQLIEFLRSKGIFVFFVQFTPYSRDDLERHFLEQKNEFFSKHEIDCIWCEDLLSMFGQEIGISHIKAAYSDNHHLKSEIANQLGFKIAENFSNKLSAPKQAPAKKTDESISPFLVLDADYNPQSAHHSRRIKNSLIDLQTIELSRNETIFEIDDAHVGYEIIGISFNAISANGVIRIASKQTIIKNFSNNSRNFWEKELIWSRPIHTRITMDSFVKLKLEDVSANVENTEFCRIENYKKDDLDSFELVALLCKQIPRTRKHRQDLFRQELGDVVTTNLKKKLAKLFEKRQHNELIELVNIGLSIFPSEAFLYKVLGNALLQKNELTEAIRVIRICCDIDAQDHEALNSLATAYQYLGQKNTAIELYRRAISLKQNYLAAYLNLADTLDSEGMTNEAISTLVHASRTHPKSEAVITKIAMLFTKHENWQEAENAWKNSLAETPNSFEAHNNLGTVYFKTGRVNEAEQHYLKALQINKDFVPAWCNLSQLKIDQGDYFQAKKAASNAVSKDPFNSSALNKLAAALRGLGELHEAEKVLRRALRIDPYDQTARINIAHILLLLGKIEEGFAFNENRPRSLDDLQQQITSIDITPRWHGENLNGKHILILPEQGIGDQIQFVRYVTSLEELGAEKVTMLCGRAFFPIAKTLRSSIFNPIQFTVDLPKFDFWCELMSLPFVLRTTSDSIPNKVPYIYSNEALKKSLKEQLEKIQGIKIGICWKGASGYKYDAERSIDLSHFSRLDKVFGLTFFCLQENGREQFLREFPSKAFDLGHEIDSHVQAFEESMALIESLDLVITCDTSIGHLAGALGKTTWLLLPFISDWRWGLSGDNSAWYPKTKMFRQNCDRNWDSVFEAVATELEKLVRVKQEDNPWKSDSNFLLVPTSYGEYLDKISILEIKLAKIQDQEKLRNIQRELNHLNEILPEKIQSDALIQELRTQLSEVNKLIWNVEDSIREFEKHQEFGQDFISLARAVYTQNDQRAKIKAKINLLTGSTLKEEKSYS